MILGNCLKKGGGVKCSGRDHSVKEAVWEVEGGLGGGTHHPWEEEKSLEKVMPGGQVQVSSCVCVRARAHACACAWHGWTEGEGSREGILVGWFGVRLDRWGSPHLKGSSPPLPLLFLTKFKAVLARE